MIKRVLDVGNCAMDHDAIRQLVESNFPAEVRQAHAAEDAITALRDGDFALVLVNRQLDSDYSDGIEVIRRLKNDAELATVPVMMITNYAQHQDSAVAAGAERGFGKSELSHASTLETLGRFLQS